MRYYAVDLHGMPTEAKTELTSQFQWIHEYYMGCNTDGTGPDRCADHHIFLRTKNPDDLVTVLLKIHQDHRCGPILRMIEEDFIPFGQKQGIDSIFTRDYSDTTVKPVPYTFTPHE